MDGERTETRRNIRSGRQQTGGRCTDGKNQSLAGKRARLLRDRTYQQEQRSIEAGDRRVEERALRYVARQDRQPCADHNGRAYSHRLHPTGDRRRAKRLYRRYVDAHARRHATSRTTASHRRVDRK